MNVESKESYQRQVHRIVESAIATGNYQLAQMYITEAAEFDADFALALQSVYDEAWAAEHPTELAVY